MSLPTVRARRIGVEATNFDKITIFILSNRRSVSKEVIPKNRVNSTNELIERNLFSEKSI